MTTQVAELEPVLRRDYRPPAHWIDEVQLAFDLCPDATRVRARLSVRRNPAENDGSAPLELLGEELETLAVRVDGRELSAEEYELSEERLSIASVPERFVLETEVVIRPGRNKALSGLYLSSGNFCTQCEAEGFRRITWFLDRPDVMARYAVEITGDVEHTPVMLSNGNRVEDVDLGGGRRRVRWEDPFRKPSYLFALVAGKLACHAGHFTTRSGREVRLEIWVEPREIDKCEHALCSLEKAMAWDEERFGLEYDLDLYMIVAVGDFNMGAMENKGLNVFNSAYVLAKPETATDDDYEAIEGVIGHEYFHNWTGNRVTLRDWFQLTLKEGLTVFRDEEFTSDTTSRAVKRIQDVQSLRTVQFAEDAGPTAHPVRPESYVRMDNFYTSTVYRKGAEVVRMVQTLLGRAGFRRGMDLYVERHDGQAVTCDDFLAAMADANGVDLSQFARWYAQAGTPTVRARGRWDAAERTYALTLSQSVPEKQRVEPWRPLHVPVAVGLVGPNGRDLPLELEGEPARAELGSSAPTTRVLELCAVEQTFVFTGVTAQPVPSILRDLSAPVRLEVERAPGELAFLAACDADPFNRWEALQELARGVLLDLARRAATALPLELDPGLARAFGKVLDDRSLDGSLAALALALPPEKELAQHVEVVDPDALFAARRFAVRALAESHAELLRRTYDAARADAARANARRGELDRSSASGKSASGAGDARSIAARRLANAALAYLAALETEETTALVARQFDGADNMTDSYAALSILSRLDHKESERALAAFYTRWKGDALVIDKWFAVQARSTRAGTLERVLELARHPDFTLENPNRVRALVGVFCAWNQVHFHRADGAGYRFLGDQVIALDALNPQVAARMVSALNPWRRFDAGRGALMQAELARILAQPTLSKDVGEIAGKALAG